MVDIPTFKEQIETLLQQYNAVHHAVAVKPERVSENGQHISTEYIKQKLALLRDAWLSIPPAREKPITIPHIFHMQNDENFMSDYVAYVLHPKRNGIGTAPLECLIEEVFHQVVKLDADTIRIDREYPIKENRLDLVVWDDDEPLLVIENKLYSSEGNRQTFRYYKAIKDAYPYADTRFLYLHISGDAARSEQFHSLTYARLYSVLRDVSYDWRQDVRNSVLWEDFLHHIQEHIIMEKGEIQISDYTQLYFKNYTMIHQLENKFKEEWAGIIEYSEAKLIARLASIPDQLKTAFQTSTRYTWQQVYKQGWITDNLSIHFEFHLGPESFESGKVLFTVDVEEGKSSGVKSFWRLYNEQLPALKSQFEAKGITYFERSVRERPYTLAYKYYPFTPDLSCIDEELFQAIQEFSFLVQPIDEIVSQVNNNI